MSAHVGDLMVRYLSALFSNPSAARPETPHADKDSDRHDFLKLDNEVSIRRDRIEVGTFLYDRKSSPTRAGSWATRLFSFIKQWRATRWVASFVETRLKHLPGSQEFVTHIRRQGGVRRDELIDFLLEQRLSGITEKALGRGMGNSFGEYQIAELESAIRGRMSSVFGARIGPPEIQAFLDFTDGGCLDVRRERRAETESFARQFAEFAKDQPQHSLVKIMQGKVRLLERRLEEDRQYFATCAEFMKKIESIPGKLLTPERSTPGWPDFLLAVAEGAKGHGEFQASTESYWPLEYAEHYLDRQAQSTDGTVDSVRQDKIWEATVERVFIRFNLRDSRDQLQACDVDVADTFADPLRDASDAKTRLGLDAFIRYCSKGPVSITTHALPVLRALTSDSIKQWCEQTFRAQDELEDIKVWADNLFLQCQRDLDTFEGSS